jgi:hypothetical protein
MQKQIVYRTNNHLDGVPIPEVADDDRIWSSQELAAHLNYPALLGIVLPPLSESERLAGIVVGWRKTTTCQTSTIEGKGCLSDTTERWELGKWKGGGGSQNLQGIRLSDLRATSF